MIGSRSAEHSSFLVLLYRLNYERTWTKLFSICVAIFSAAEPFLFSKRPLKASYDTTLTTSTKISTQEEKMLRDEAEMKVRIELEYRLKAEAEARERIEAEMRAQEELREQEIAAAKAEAEAHAGITSKSVGGANGISSGGAGRNGMSVGAVARSMPLASPGGSSDGTDVVSLSARSSDGGGSPPFTEGRMLDDMEAEEMCSAITQIFLKKTKGSPPFVLFNIVLKTNRRRWTIERRYSDFVYLHEVCACVRVCVCFAVAYMLFSAERGLCWWKRAKR